MFLTLAFFGVCGGAGHVSFIGSDSKKCMFLWHWFWVLGSGLKHFSWLRSENQGVFLLLALISGPRWVLWLTLFSTILRCGHRLLNGESQLS